MASLNKVQLIGNLTADPEIKETPSGQKVANFSIATDRTWKDSNGMKQEQVEFHRIVAWSFLAELAEKYMQKGKKIYLEGRLQTRNWDDPSWQKRYATEVVAENIILLSSPAGNQWNSDYSAPFTPSVQNSTMNEPSEVSPQKTRKWTPKAEEDITIEDIPF